MLESHGKLAIAELCIYPIVLLLTITNFIWIPRGGKRDTAWIYIALFCAFRIVGSALVINIEQTGSSSVGLYIAASIANGLALSPLLLSGVGFASTCSNAHPEPNKARSIILLSAHLTNSAAIVLSIVGSTKIVPPYKMDQIDTGVSLLRVSPFLYIVAIGLLGTAVFQQWRTRFDITVTGGPKILQAVALSIPFLLIRTLYVFLVAFNTKKAIPGTFTNKYNVMNGQWGYYFGLALVMEFAVVAIYLWTGISLHRFGRAPASYNPGGRVKGGNGRGSELA